MRKAQIAMETLLVYGLAILVVLLVVGALIYFGVLDFGRLVPDKCTVASSDIECSDFKAVQGGTLSIEITNKASETIVVSSAKTTSLDSGITLPVTYTPGSPVTVLPGGKYVLPFANGVAANTKGQKAKVQFEVTYKRGTSTLDHTSTGQLTASVSS